MSYEDTFRSLKVKNFIGITKDFSFRRRNIDLSLKEHDTEHRLFKTETFEKKPNVPADAVSSTGTVAAPANKDFCLLGTNAVSTCTALDADGGFVATTTTADGDMCIITPHTTAGVSGWFVTTLPTDNKIRFATRVKTGASIALAVIWAGFKLTNTDVKATDNDQTYFRYEVGVNSGKWECVDSNNNTDTVTDSGVTVAVSTVYDLVIEVDASRVPRYYINDVLVVTGNALKTGVTALIPYIGVYAKGTTPGAKALTVRYLNCSREY